MIKYLAKILALVYVLFVSVPACLAQSRIAESELSYQLNSSGDGVVITAYNGNSQAVILPKTVEGMPVTEVRNIFRDSKNTEVVVIEEGFAKIDDKQFQSCRYLKKIVIPSTVTKIGQSAFQNCAKLTEVAMPDSVSEIGSYAFSGCSSLTSISIPKSVTKIMPYTFNGCEAIRELVIHEGVTEIGDSAFSGCKKLAELTVPHSAVISLLTNTGALRNCGLKKLTLAYTGDLYGDYMKAEKAIAETPRTNFYGGYDDSVLPYPKTKEDAKMAIVKNLGGSAAYSVEVPGKFFGITNAAMFPKGETTVELPAHTEFIRGKFSKSVTNVVVAEGVSKIEFIDEDKEKYEFFDGNALFREENGFTSSDTFSNCKLPLAVQAKLRNIGYKGTFATN